MVGKKFGLDKKLIVVILVLLVLAAAVSWRFTGEGIKSFFGLEEEASGVVVQGVVVNKQNLPVFLQNVNFVDELPKNAEIELKLYNFDSGSRQWEESYVIQKGKVHQGGAVDPDVVAVIDSDYLSELANFCPTIQKAKVAGDFGIEYKKSKTGLLWKYKGMLKYKKCFGF
ncbi:hypothetical protein CMI37_33140 [Candidatus Pacearchaeota archaeon]|nr:hypothetical protein [Candidatus Pacearchaeota archaeon]|tara:strand:+ start:1316 stop:1825 length:510 start_codon:yes stop_codon:yes gene_type:complete